VLLCAGGLLVWWLAPSSPALASFAEVQAALKAARTVTGRQTIRIEGKPEEVTRFRVLDQVMRGEENDGGYNLMDTANHRVLIVDAKKKEAILWLGFNTPRVNLYEMLRNLPTDATARPLAGKKLDGRDVLGFAVKLADQDATIWADAKARLPVRIEAHRKEEGKKAEFVVDELVFDKDMDAKLFAFEAPAGYKLETRGTANFPDAPGTPELKKPVVTPLVGIGPAKFGMSREDIEKVLGKADSVTPMGKSGFVNLNYHSRGFVLCVSPTRGLIMIHCNAQVTFAVRIRDFRGKTDKGIALGASQADVIKTYGKPDRQEKNDSATYFTYNAIQGSFTFFEDKLVGMMFSMQRAP
jgi:hypothetical protein